jgi:hypothetical protein
MSFVRSAELGCFWSKKFVDVLYLSVGWSVTRWMVRGSIKDGSFFSVHY